MKLLSLNHKTADVGVRERYALSGFAQNSEQVLQRFFELENVDEVAVLSTCNRVEVIWCGEASYDRMLAEWAQLVGGNADELRAAIHQFEEQDAVRHFMCVCAGVESMVLGEPQILGQAKDAFALAKQADTIAVELHRFFERAFQAAKKVRTETEIGENAVSISYYAVKLASQVFDELRDVNVLVLGAGEMAELAIRHFIEQGVEEIFVWNRTASRATELAQELNVAAVPTQMFDYSLEQADVVLVSTGAPNYVLNAAMVKEIQKRRRNRPYFVLDISVPRNADPAIQQLSNVYLYDIDRLQTLCDKNAAKRSAAVADAKKIIEIQSHQFAARAMQAEKVRIAGYIHAHWQELAEKQLLKTVARTGWKDDELEAARTMLSAVIKQQMHPVQQFIKSQGDPSGSEITSGGESSELAHHLSEIFGLENPHTKDHNQRKTS